MNITLKSLPEEIGEELKRAAVRSSRSLNREIIHRLTESLRRERREISGRVADSPDRVADVWAALGGGWNSDLTAEDEIEVLYATRSIGRETDLNW